MHRTYIADIERGVRNITLRSIINLAAALQVSVSALLAEPGDLQPAGEFAPREILVVESSATDADALVRAFAEANITNPITVVRDGAEAFDYLGARGEFRSRAGRPAPQLILLDANLARGTGLEVLRRLRGDEATRRIPVVMLFSGRDERTEQEAARLGAEQVILKPVAFDKFAQIIPKLRLHWALLSRNGHA